MQNDRDYFEDDAPRANVCDCGAWLPLGSDLCTACKAEESREGEILWQQSRLRDALEAVAASKKVVADAAAKLGELGYSDDEDLPSEEVEAYAVAAKGSAKDAYLAGYERAKLVYKY